MKTKFEYLYDEKMKRNSVYVWEGMTLITFTSMDGNKPATQEEKTLFEKEYHKDAKTKTK